MGMHSPGEGAERLGWRQELGPQGLRGQNQQSDFVPDMVKNHLLAKQSP